MPPSSAATATSSGLMSMRPVDQARAMCDARLARISTLISPALPSSISGLESSSRLNWRTPSCRIAASAVVVSRPSRLLLRRSASRSNKRQSIGSCSTMSDRSLGESSSPAEASSSASNCFERGRTGRAWCSK